MYKNMNEALQDKLIKNKEQTYIKTPENEFTYGEFLKLVVKWKGELKSQGVRRGDRVAIISEKCYEQLIAFYAIWSLGAIVVPINESLSKAEISVIVSDARPIIILTSERFFDFVDSLKVPTLNYNIFEAAAETKVEEYSYEDSEPSDVAAIIYTSGSTGTPKGVVTTHDNFIVNAMSAASHVSITDKDSLYSLLPFWHSFALTVEVVVPVLYGSTICFAKGQRDFVDNIPKYNPSVIMVVPRILAVVKERIIKKVNGSQGLAKLFNSAYKYVTGIGEDSKGYQKYLASFLQKVVFKKIRKTFGRNLRFFISGGAPLDSELQSFYTTLGLNILQGYGLSEVSPIISVDTPWSPTSGSVGPVLDWLKKDHQGDFAFRDDEGNISKDIQGELLVKGRCVMKGYWNHRDEAAKEIDKRGWLHTGDIGVLDKDGKLFIKGRKTNMIVLAGGENVYPEYIENIVKKSSYIEDAMVVPGKNYKNLYVCITIIEEYKNQPEDELKSKSWQDIKNQTKDLAAYEKPKGFIVLPNFNPEDGTYTSTMKIRRHVVRELYQEAIETLISSTHG